VCATAAGTENNHLYKNTPLIIGLTWENTSHAGISLFTVVAPLQKTKRCAWIATHGGKLLQPIYSSLFHLRTVECFMTL